MSGKSVRGRGAENPLANHDEFTPPFSLIGLNMSGPGKRQVKQRVIKTSLRVRSETFLELKLFSCSFCIDVSPPFQCPKIPFVKV